MQVVVEDPKSLRYPNFDELDNGAVFEVRDGRIFVKMIFEDRQGPFYVFEPSVNRFYSAPYINNMLITRVFGHAELRVS